jgi:HEAT repeat protein
MQPSPDYGTLGPTSDVASLAAPASGLLTPAPNVSGVSASSRQRQQSLCRLSVFAAIVGAAVALAFSSVRSSGAHWEKLARPLAAKQPSSVSSSMLSDAELDRQRPQQQAEILLERAVTRSGEDASVVQAETAAEIEARLDTWRGKLKWDAELGELTTAALNSSDYSVRTSAIEVQLAAYGLTKSDSSVNALVRQADSSDHAQKDWALWALGLLGNRGIETDRVVRVLTAHLKDSGKNSESDSDEETRRWAVEGLALVGTTSTIVPLLNAMHSDPSPIVRERAACSLAESGMLTHQQRLAAVPQLINYSDDPALDAQTHAWAFQALTEITKQHLPNDSAAWRKAVASGQ